MRTEIRHNIGEIIDALAASSRRIENAIGRAANELRGEVDSRYQVTYQSWRHRPDVSVDVHAHGRRIDIEVQTDEVYDYVDRGTSPHIILPIRAKRLHFLNGYQPKTTPGVLGSGTGGAYGDDVFARMVRHPGTQARGFTRIVSNWVHQNGDNILWKQLLQALNRR